VSGPLRLGLVGYGKIAHDQHVPAIAGTDGLELAAVASRNNTAPGLANYRTLDAMLAAEPGLDAIILCQPPQARFESARDALLAGKHVFMEKPPGASVSEVEALIELARRQGVTLFASWHSRYARYVAAARRWVAERPIERVTITWKEDVRHWHPGQEWIWQAGGFGVFDPGINALSILTEILPERVRLIDARLETPSNKQAPIAARLTMAAASGTPISAEFDFRQTGPQSWDIVIEAAGERLCLGHGGNSLSIESPADDHAIDGEYPAMYRHFAQLVRDGASDVDLAPLQLVADAFLRGHIELTEPYEE
jgi:D-galactose 1-dehydrogenase